MCAGIRFSTRAVGATFIIILHNHCRFLYGYLRFLPSALNGRGHRDNRRLHWGIWRSATTTLKNS